MFGSLPPWLSGLMGQQGMQSGMQQPVPMTPGAGMPPSQAPGGPSAMGPMGAPGQMQPPQGGPPQPMQQPQGQGQGQGPMNPAQMMMLQQALRGQTAQPPPIEPRAPEGAFSGVEPPPGSAIPGVQQQGMPGMIPPWLLGMIPGMR